MVVVMKGCVDGGAVGRMAEGCGGSMVGLIWVYVAAPTSTILSCDNSLNIDPSAVVGVCVDIETMIGGGGAGGGGNSWCNGISTLANSVPFPLKSLSDICLPFGVLLSCFQS